MTKRTFMRAELQDGPAPVAPALRGFVPGDEPALGELMFSAYLGTIDQEEGTIEQAHDEIRKTVAGDYGSFDPQCSRLLQRNGQLLSATLITRFQDRPFVAFSLTAPAHKNQGLARTCMRAAMAALVARGEHELRLVVTRANAPAYHLYSSLGFKEEAA